MLLAPELAADVMPLLQSATSSYSSPIPSVGRVQFEFDFPLLMAIGIVILGVAVSVGVWSAGTAPAPSGGVVLSVSSFGMTGENSSSSWWNMTWHHQSN